MYEIISEFHDAITLNGAKPVRIMLKNCRRLIFEIISVFIKKFISQTYLLCYCTEKCK